ncbi:hypothetical protein [Mucilaginibacter lappiensis]|uniref:Uncharacterized protein n=1 Tax=Mucilaginibacter lappiensis TaxID=354630 RepID=A0A841JE23_9SPHI|nr:hypothetical protein [Mucilaginibacter lappiensis]MBB6129403.1 hypothetical protein [Mucilaginibacter lappiensis]
MTNKQKLICFFLILLVCRIILGIWSEITELQENDYEFAGILQKIDYDEKGIPKVMVNGKQYWGISTRLDFNKKMEVGDSLIKKKNEMIYKLVKYKTGEVVISK